MQRVLHTAAHYAANMLENLNVDNIVPTDPVNIETTKTQLINYMLENEKTIYNYFFPGQCNSIYDFIEKIRELFTSEYIADMKFLEYFDNTAGFQQRLVKEGIYENVNLYEEIDFTITYQMGNQTQTITKTVKPKRIKKPDSSNPYVMGAIDIKSKLIDLEIPEFRGIKKESPNMEVVLQRIAIDRPIYDIIGQSFNFTGKNGNNVTVSLSSKNPISLKDLNTSFSVPLEALRKDSANSRKLIYQTVHRLYRDALRYAGGSISQEMKDCYMNWAIEYLTGEISKTGYATAAANWNKVVGNLGEIKTKLLFDYIHTRQQTQGFGDTVKDVIGDMYGKVQARTDIQLILGNFIGGIQAKNYSGFTKTGNLKDTFKLDTTQDYLNTIKDGDLKSGVLRKKLEEYGVNVADLDVFLANYAFITFGTVDYTQIKTEIEEALGYLFAVIANYDTQSRYRKYWDVNNLYLIGGRYLVPVSWLYEQVLSWSEYKTKKATVFIKATPQYVSKNLYHGKTEGLKHYHEYWEKDENGWTYINPSQFNNMLSKVRITTRIPKISYSEKSGVGQFALY